MRNDPNAEIEDAAAANKPRGRSRLLASRQNSASSSSNGGNTEERKVRFRAEPSVSTVETVTPALSLANEDDLVSPYSSRYGRSGAGSGVGSGGRQRSASVRPTSFRSSMSNYNNFPLAVRDKVCFRVSCTFAQHNRIKSES